MRCRTVSFFLTMVFLVCCAGCATAPRKIELIENDSSLRTAAQSQDLDGAYKEIIHRDSVPLKKAYGPEFDYIRTRRQAARHEAVASSVESAPAIPSNLVGVCFSGGGIRSASFNLGVLNAFEDNGRLKDVDYLSCVSGGAYAGAWFVAHQLPEDAPKSPLFGSNGVLTHSSDPGQLLSFQSHAGQDAADAPPLPSPFMHLQGNSPFIFNDKSGMGLIKGVGDWLWRWPIHAVFDVGLHYKPTRGKFNFYHPIYIYRDRLEKLYLPMSADSSDQILLSEINPNGSSAPYLIVNAALNLGWSRNANLPFEFTRDFCGAPELGYIRTQLFDKPVRSVLRKDGRAKYVKVSKKPTPWTEVKPFRLSTALAASGAAMDPAGTDNIILYPLMKFFNLALRYQTRNYAQNFADPWWWPVDRLREMTVGRFVGTKTENTLRISDGGHYENLGIVALAKRRVAEIYVFDASADPFYQYESLQEARRRLTQTLCACGDSYLFWDLEPLQPFAFGREATNAPALPYRLDSTISCAACGYRATVHYGKLACRNDYPHVPEMVRRFGKFEAEKKPLKKRFPHTPTSTQWYDYAQFEAYRQLGYYVADRMLEAESHQ